MGFTLGLASDMQVSSTHDGWKYLVGRDGPQDFARAMELFQQGYEQGEVAACGLLGWMFLEGSGVQRDVSTALRYLEEAYTNGDAATCGVLASMYLDGNGVEQNVDKAIPLLEEGRRRGLVAASRMLGQLYLLGNGIEKNAELAASFLHEASMCGDVAAENMLNFALQARVPAVSLQHLRHGEPSSCTEAHDSLSQRGFCWLIMDDNQVTSAAGAATTMSHDFLAGPGNNTGQTGALTGHLTSKHKDGICLLTGDYTQTVTNIGLPNEVHDALKDLMQVLDTVQSDIAQHLAPFFAREPNSSNDWWTQAALLNDTGKKYGIMDCVLYRPQQSTSTVVMPHVDPGLLILSLPSDPGLELQDEADRWLSPPEGCGVLWTGRAASGCKPGVHRVVIGDAPRFALWHELCTRTQLAPPMLEQLEARGEELQFGDTRGTKAVLDLFRRTENHEMPRDGVERAQLRGILGIKALKLEPMSIDKLTQSAKPSRLSRPSLTDLPARTDLKKMFQADLERIKRRQLHS